MTKLSVNVNKIALLRNSRGHDMPSVIDACRTALDAGAHGITVHPRPDQRHATPADCDRIKALLAEPAYAERGIELNIEGNPLDLSRGDHLMPIHRRVRPDQATLVPDDPTQKTSDHGFDLSPAGGMAERLKPVIAKLKDLGCRVSLFMDPDVEQIERVPATGADRVELYTEAYARVHADDPGAAADMLERYRLAAEAARRLGLGVNAGHDLNLQNLGDFIEAIPFCNEVSIGHALIADALDMGLEQAVKAYLRVMMA